jgi:hypothetical protein
MKKCYLLAHSSAAASHAQMKTILNTIDEVVHWRSEMACVFFVVSEKSASDLTKLIRAQSGDKGRFIISEITQNRNGWITKDSWYMINNKELKPPE